MKLLAVVFGGIALLAALLGFGANVIPILSLSGKVVALMALAGLAITAGTYATETEEETPLFDFEADHFHR